MAIRCKRLLLDCGINEIDVEIRQSEPIRSAGPQLLQPTFDIGLTVDVREPFTATLGITICAQCMPRTEGTSFFLEEGGDGKWFLLATARHVILRQADNKVFECKSESQRRHCVLVVSGTTFQWHLALIQDQIKARDTILRYQTKRIEKVAGREDDGAIVEREDALRRQSIHAKCFSGTLGRW